MAAAQEPADRLSTLLEGVHPGWLAFFEEHGLAATARAALARLDGETLAPSEDLIFEFLRYFGPEDSLVLVMGQDPYPQDAQGVCFSIPPGHPLKDSLKTIINSLEKQGVARTHHRAAGDGDSPRIRCGDLRAWAAQGVILMNAALTTRVGARGSHRGIWKEFTMAFVRGIAALCAPVFLLWGNDAQAFAPAAHDGSGGKAKILTWTHPSPLVNNRLPEGEKFENSGHFKATNVALRRAGRPRIEWDPLAYTHAFTDGGCIRNGQPNAEASFAVYFMTGPLRHTEVSGRVAPHEYAFVDPADPLKGFAPIAHVFAAPTNNRGEYLAWCWALLLLLRSGAQGRAEIISDCNLFIQTMEEWLPARRRKGTAGELKNYDLVQIGETLLAALRAASLFGPTGVLLTHVHSHQKKPPDSDPRAQGFWYGNDRADQLAGAVLAAADSSAAVVPDFIVNTTPALTWRLCKRWA